MVNKNPIDHLDKFVLCREKNSRVQVCVWGEISDGCLKISGQDLGVAPLEFWGDDEYEYFYTFSKDNTACLISLLNATPHDLKGILIERFGGINGIKDLRKFADKHNIAYEFFSC